MYQRMLADMTGAQGNKKNKRTVSAALILLLAKLYPRTRLCSERGGGGGQKTG